jgi:ABC-2 type transport system permease protein
LTAFKSLSVAMTKGFVRDKASLFFAFLFPLMFLVIFGLLYRDTGTDKITLGLTGTGPVIEALAQSPAVDDERLATAADAAGKVADGDLDGAVLQAGDDIKVSFAASDQNRAAILQSVVSDAVNQAAATGQPARFKVTPEQIQDRTLKPIQYLTPGILSWAVAFAGVSGSALTFVAWRKKQVLRRLWLAPISPRTVLSSRIGVTLGIAVVQGVLFVGLACLPLFGLRLSGTWALSIPVFLLGTLAFLTIGLLIGAFARTEEAANGASQLVVFPMAFLSGAFFPIDQSPGWLQAVSAIFPLRYMNDAMQDFLVRGAGPQALLVPCGALIAFTLVVGFVATKVFRWDDS